ncbi:uncharacterized protein LOC127254149 [Andrographis paniculata]|uniref:uncharacterized protein LOC127254149 n=1 Tax=Andrographis paniculata TaxID=175694 RepID=UPI0021E715A3|nr:uncharacterized protein LOC127254149 [Andrographis paniculata]
MAMPICRRSTLQISSSLKCLYFIRRAYAVHTATSTSASASASAATSAVETAKIVPLMGKVGDESAAIGKQVFWMKDPKSGNWIPESQFGHQELDVADLRAKFLSKNRQP